MKYASVDVKKSAKMPPVPIEIHFYLTADLSRSETFQTSSSFGTNVHEINNAVRFIEKKTENHSNAGMKFKYPLVFGTILVT